MPKGDRGLLTYKKDESPNPLSYQNTNEIAVKSILKKNAAFTIP
jgi:hypothetical protein